MKTVDEILDFWLDDIGPDGWYDSSKEIDRRVREFALETYGKVLNGSAGFWLTYPKGALAYIIVLDQFPRNIFRDTAQAFSSDRVAHAVACAVLDKGWDMKLDLPGRNFFYLPLMHSENLSDQERCVRKFLAQDSADAATGLLHARAHREVIRRYGRFPYRNVALGRKSTSAEKTFLENDLYSAFVESIKAKGSAAEIR